jgi:Flp pilus assembly protein TadB
MATLDDKIASLEEKIEGYENDLKIATTAEEKRDLRGLIKSCRDNLTELLKQKNSQPGISFIIAMLSLVTFLLLTFLFIIV